MVQIEEYSTEGCEFELREDSGAGCVKESSFDEIEDTIMPENHLNKMLNSFVLGQLQGVTYSDYQIKAMKNMINYTCIMGKEFVHKFSALWTH